MVVTTSHEPPQAAAPGSTRSSCPDVGCIPMCGSARSAARHPAARRRADRNRFFVVVVTLFPLGIGPGLSYADDCTGRDLGRCAAFVDVDVATALRPTTPSTLEQMLLSVSPAGSSPSQKSSRTGW